MNLTPVDDPRHPGRYAIRWPRPGRTPSGRVRTGYADGFRTRKAAKDHALAMVQAEAVTPAVERNAANRTLASFYAEWIAAYDIGHPPATAQTQRTRMRPVMREWGSTPVVELDGYAIEAWLRDRRRLDGKPYSANSTKNARANIRHILKLAVQRGALRSNPMDGLFTTKPRGKAATLGSGTRRHLVPTLAEYHAVRDELWPERRIVPDIMLETGCRLGEAIGLHVDALDFGAGLVHFVSQLDAYGNTRAQLKTGLGTERTVPMTDRLADLLTAHLLENPGPDGLVVGNRIGGPLRDHKIEEDWLKARRRAGVREDFKIEHLRHRFATYLLDRGEDVGIVASWLGHDPLTTRRYYQLAPGVDAAERLRQASRDAQNAYESARTMRATDPS